MTAPARSRPTVLIADDHAAMRAALVRLVSVECDVVGAVADGEAMVYDARRLRPDLVIADLYMPVLDGFAAGRQIKRSLPETRLIYVTGHADPELIAEALKIGASALVPKMSAATRLLPAIRQAMADENVARHAEDDPSARPTADPYYQLLRQFSSVLPDGDNRLADVTALRARLTRLSVPALAVDGQGRYIAVNDAAAALTGFAVIELEAMNVCDLTPAPEAERRERLWTEFITVGEQWGTFSIRRKHGVPTDVYYYARAHVLRDVHLSLLCVSEAGSPTTGENP